MLCHLTEKGLLVVEVIVSVYTFRMRLVNKPITGLFKGRLDEEDNIDLDLHCAVFKE